MTTTPVAAVEISPARAQTEYSRHLFGHFIEHFHRQVYGGIFEPGSPLADERGFRLDVIEALRDLSVPNVRWPGGCFVSTYDWVDGIGPDRKPTFDPAWRVNDPNTFGTDEFIAWCDAIGADAYICTNAGTGTPQEMSEWLEYTNRPTGSRWSDLRAEYGHPEPYAVPFWSIGNENYGDWELGAKTGAEWAAFVTESAKLMLRIDPDVKLLAAAFEDKDWILPMLEQAGRYLDYISIHGYWDKLHEVNKPTDYLGAMSKTLGPEGQIALVRSMIEVSGQQHIKIAFDEWNLRGWHHPVGNTPEAINARDLNDDNSTYTMADAIFSAAFLNSCLRNSDKVSMANLAPTVNARGPLFVHPTGVVKRTTFHVMQMYANLLGPRVLDSAVQSIALDTGAGEVPLVDAIATGDDDGNTVFVLVNKSDKDAAPVRVRIDGVALTGEFAATTLIGDHPDAFNDVDHPDAVTPQTTTVLFVDGVVTLPAHSITLCTAPATARVPGGSPWEF